MDFDLDDAVRILERTPALLRTWLSGLPEAWIRADEGPETWSAFAVVGHLLDGDETDWMTRVHRILGPPEERRFKPYDRFRHLARNRDRTLPELLDAFATLRAENLRALTALELGPADLARTGIHPEFGEVTLAQLLATWVAHDLGHIAQIARVLAKQYRTAVGPWTAYLPVLTR
ncbi:MAG: DinB family protein [Gemmatimonadota bacterium]|nr:DinB family protein [Gemmatimonadota bacterium]